jgi:hypothetical protein
MKERRRAIIEIPKEKPKLQYKKIKKSGCRALVL